jgi:hypothetical protein
VALVACTVALVALVPSTATAKPNGVHALANVDQLAGGGQSKWGVDSSSSTCIDKFSTGGLAIEDASLQSTTWDDDFDPPAAPPPWDDAYDGAFMGFVDGVPVPGSTPVITNTTTTYTAGPASLSGLQITVRYDSFASDPILRALFAFTNPIGAPVTVQFGLGNNVGSDTNTTIKGSASGDTVAGIDDSWITSDQGAFLADNDPVDTFVLFGNGAAVTPNSFGPNCGVLGQPTSFDDLGPLYTVSIPAGSTKYLMFFGAIDTASEAALTRGPSLVPITTSSAFVADLSPDVTCNIVNWAFGACAPVARFTG